MKCFAAVGARLDALIAVTGATSRKTSHCATEHIEEPQFVAAVYHLVQGDTPCET